NGVDMTDTNDKSAKKVATPTTTTPARSTPVSSGAGASRGTAGLLHTKMTGATTSAPTKSPIHQARHTGRISATRTTPPPLRLTTPTLALTIAPTTAPKI